jgi:uncharacterized protein YhaN
MEDENKAVQALEAKHSKVRHAKVLIEKNNQNFINKAKALEKQFKRKKIGQDEYTSKLEELKAELKAANKPIQDDLQTEGEEFNPPLPDVSEEEVVVAEV